MEGSLIDGETILLLIILFVVLPGMFIYVHRRTRSERRSGQSQQPDSTATAASSVKDHARRAFEDCRRLGPWLLVPLILGLFDILFPLLCALYTASSPLFGPATRGYHLWRAFANERSEPGLWMTSAFLEAGVRVWAGLTKALESPPGALVLLIFSVAVIVGVRRRNRPSPRGALPLSILLMVVAAYLLSSQSIISFSFLVNLTPPPSMLFLHAAQASFLPYPAAFAASMPVWVALVRFVLQARLTWNRPSPALVLRSLRKSFLLQFSLYLVAGLPAMAMGLAALIFGLTAGPSFSSWDPDSVSLWVGADTFFAVSGLFLWLVAFPVGLIAGFKGWSLRDLARFGPAFLRRHGRVLAATFFLFWAGYVLLDTVHWHASRFFVFPEQTGAWPGIFLGMVIKITVPVLSVFPMCILFRLTDDEARQV